MAENMMRCPYCDKIFWVTEDEQYENETFKCPYCGKENAGCTETDEYGVLVGISLLDYQLRELLS